MIIEIKPPSGYGHTTFINTENIITCRAEYYYWAWYIVINEDIKIVVKKTDNNISYDEQLLYIEKYIKKEILGLC